ncbi:fumarylacetoacetate hydrolase family protein [Nesterenkonia sp. LB17]|uniref:fumarylacetoacetate hydrolase family protein n=1 Tax=unclassified Nesterenkonia TaxID=2629769 RepID=UPI001F4C87A9|nr:MULTISPECIES: fumarylacetoacetate hydrolase family protein [unclassified Nesterenkonia]MCH8559138.1 fumarylacetoacetate hydrolase family protein [Nesterenkonia sp. DZ6]MCH8563052.1 fumarylacetoacetate hydrolase family protein [Nesterenkonia sp. YGD6]MCH8565132.1 fumarylacetoacetate hydrolase family protein [Nesterenkonia sp. LB17]
MTAQELGTPGKIVAVHISYESRAAERGRRPATPSYFFKPTSSLGVSGDSVQRPGGTELLAFEGEIALIIGTAARQVTADDAWSHVRAVTAANDWGLYDLRAADKGSNVRNKGRDGYTTVGPELIDAAEVDPRKLRVRTWKNGHLVQDGATGSMIFPLTQLIADLSQHMTLQPGDIILTGTPAGASVAEPGDTIEVEVDAARGLTSGRLVSPVTEGPGVFDPALGSLPSVDDTQREEAWGSREAAGLPPKQAPGLDPELRATLEQVPVAALSQEMRRRGYNNVTVDGVRPTRPGHKLIGTARTLRFVPHREDLFASRGGGFNAQKQVFDSVHSGEVIVIEARGERGSGTLGDILALRALHRGAAGVVTDGGVRDYSTVAEIGLPVFSQGPHPAVLGRKHVPWDADLTVACGGATVQPGDIIVGDDDGVIVLPPSIADEVAEAALVKEAEDAWVAEQVKAGNPVDGLFPMNSTWRARYEAEQGRAGAEAPLVKGEGP